MKAAREPKRHHYVAQFLQKGFADGEGKVWLYDRRLQKFTHTSPKNVCCENDLYMIDPRGSRNPYIEAEWLSSVDGEGASAIRKLEAGIELDDEWRESFSVFMAQQITRTPAFRDLTVKTHRLVGDEYLRIGFTNVERATALLKNYRERTGDLKADTVTAESLVEDVTGGHVVTSVQPETFLLPMMRQLEFLARLIVSFEWTVTRAPKETGFILCDYPFVLVPRQEHPDLTGFGFPGTVKYFPLTKGLCLKMGEEGFGFSYQSASREEVRIINQNIAVNSERFILGPSREQLAHVINRSGTSAADGATRTTSDVVQRDSDGALIRMTFWPQRKFFYPKV